MSDPSTTQRPETPPLQNPATQPPPIAADRAKAMKAKGVAAAWADVVDEMDTMPVQDARALKPKDIGVHFGPMMTAEEFAEYRKTRNVRVMK